MQDRQPGKPGQHKATLTAAEFQKMQTGQQFTITMIRDDQPIVEGTPYSKAAVLPDAVAESICPGVNNPTPADAFRALQSKKAPSGFGSGDDPKVLSSFAALDSQRVSGKYFVNAGAAGAITIDGFSIGYASVDVIGKSDSAVTQRMNPYRTGYWLQRTVSYDGTVSPWEWFNPPWNLGQEYRLAERAAGKTVYGKRLNCGSLPNATYKDVSVGVVMSEVVSCEVTVTDSANEWRYQLPYISQATPRCHACIVGYAVRIYAVNYDMSNYTGKALVKYTKD